MANDKPQILIEGLRPEEFLRLPMEELQALVFRDKPIVFKAGSAEVLGQFTLNKEGFVVELAQIDGGGEGVLGLLWTLAPELARVHGYTKVDWLVHAVNCPKPNRKLKRVLERMDFKIQEVPGKGEVYHFAQIIPQDHTANAVVRLKHALQALASTHDAQLRIYPDFVDHVYELAADYGNWFEVCVDKSGLTFMPDQVEALREIDNRLNEMSGQKNEALWSDDALKRSKEWETIRSLAKSTLVLMSWPADPSPPSPDMFVRGGKG